jgi:hypothetical protein
LALLADGATGLDLTSTLPAGVPSGGSFGVSESGAELPAGVSLTAGGLLSAAPDALIGPVDGIVFTYTLP